MGQSSGKIESEGQRSSSKTAAKGPSVQADVNGKGSIVTPGTPNYKQPEGPFDSATPTRLDSRENLIDTQSDDSDPQLFLVKHDFTAQGDGQLTVHRGEKVKVMEFSDEGDWVEGTNSRGIVGWLPASYIMRCDSLEKFSWYHGNITRAAAEVALSSGINGSFLIRESESKPRQYSISLRFNGRMYHYRISQDPVTKKYFVMQDIKFPTLKELVHYHSQQADGLVCTLHYPAPNPKMPTIFSLSQADEWEINRSKIEVGQKLGGGRYGEVYKGTHLKTGQSVAVKTFIEETTDANEFLKEAAVMKKLRHAHLVQLLGVCTLELPFFIVMEYMPKGNLLDYIRGPEGRNLDAVTLVYMSQQIASAMAYLEEKGFIHRDLAARNCLVGNGYLVKVADFGLSRFVEKDVYDARSGTKFPIKWTAPEALAYNQFSIKSDIWAFGILLWELATQGMPPYPGVELVAVYELLEKGYRLECPEGCPSNIYDMMKRCWEWDPQKRPQFAELHQELNAMSNVPPTPAKSNSPTQLESQPPPTLPGAKAKELNALSNVTEGFKESDCSVLYHKAIRDSPSITLHIAKAMTIGPPRVGKTSLRHHLLGLPPPEISSSTPVMRTAEIVSMCQSDSTTAPDEVGLVNASGAVANDDCSPNSDSDSSSSDSDDDRDDLAQTVVKRSRYEAGMYIADGRRWVLVNSASGMLSLLTFLQQKGDIAAEQNPQSRTVSEGGHFEAPIQSLGDIPQTTESNPKSDISHPMHRELQEPEIANVTLPDGDFKAPLSSEKNPISVANVIHQLFQELQKPEIANVTLPDAHLLQFLDCGGQLAYHDILPLFVNIPAIYLHVFNMSKELTECPVDELCSPKGEKKYSAKSALSIVEMIKRSVMTVHSLADKKIQLPSEGKMCEGKSAEAHVFLVGTHLDKLVETGQDAKLKAINELLCKALQSRSHDLEGMVVKNPKRHIMFYPVNNMSHKKGNLRKRIRQQAKEDAVKVEVPVKWYLRQLLEMSQGEEKPLYSYSELYHRCKGEGSIADIGEFHAMVTYFHALGLLIHLCGADVGHTEDSDCLVFTNPSYLFENISKLYQVQFEEDVEGKGKIAFKSEGKLTKEALQDLRVDEDHLSHSHFMDLLVQLFIGAEIEVHEGDRTLFVPSVLTNSTEDATPTGGDSVQEHSLYFAVTFKYTSFIPCGVFTGMIARLQSAPGWEICTSSISRVLMKFSVGALGTVNVLDHATHISAEITCCEGLKRGQYQEYRDSIIQSAAESYCFLFHSKNAKDPQSGTCHMCVDRPYLVLGQTCHWCPPQPDGTRKVRHFAELKVENCVPVTVRCQETKEPKVLEDTVLERVPFQNISHYAVVKEQHTSPAQEVVVAEKVPVHVSPGTAEQVLDQFRDRFIAEMDANAVVFELEYQGYISGGDQMMISQNKDAKQQNQILHAQLKKKCMAKTLMGVCNIIAAVKGNPKMRTLGEDIQKELEKVTRTLSPSMDPLRGELLSSRPTAVLLMKKVVPAVAHKWHPLGVCLGMEAAILNTYKTTESRSVELCCLEMFECWLREGKGTGESPRTWSTVLSVIGDCLGQDVATCTEEALLEESQSHVLDQFRDRFIAGIDANAIVLELEYQGFISGGGQTTISQNKDAKQQNQILHAELKKTCTPEALLGVCDIVTAVKGNPRMRTLGVDMKKELEKGKLLSSRPTAVLLMKKVVPAVAHKWHPLGVCLGIEAAILNTYKATESRSVELCCLEMFECWLQKGRGTGESPRTWSTVLTVIGDCLGHDVATCTEEALLEESH